jgi:hypothetical protein
MVGTQHDGAAADQNMKAICVRSCHVAPNSGRTALIGADEQIDRELASDLDQAVGLRAYRQSPATHVVCALVERTMFPCT